MKAAFSESFLPLDQGVVNKTDRLCLTIRNKGHIIRAMNKLDRETRARVLHLLCEGQSIRAVTRLTGASKNTVTKLVVDAGHACTEYQDRVLRNLTSQRVQVDEIWNFVFCKND